MVPSHFGQAITIQAGVANLEKILCVCLESKVRLATLELSCLLLKQSVLSGSHCIIKDVHLACLEVCLSCHAATHAFRGMKNQSLMGQRVRPVQLNGPVINFITSLGPAPAAFQDKSHITSRFMDRKLQQPSFNVSPIGAIYHFCSI